MKLSETKKDYSALAIGASGKGKTRLCGTLVQLIPETLIVTSDLSGLQTLRTMGLDPEIIIVKDWANIWSYYEEIARLSADCLAVAFDDFGSIQKTAGDKISLEPRNYVEEQKAKKQGTHFQILVQESIMSGERQLELQQWGKLFLALDSFTSAVFRLPFRIKLFTCLEGVAKDPRTGEDHIYPQLSGQVRTTFPARFSIVAEAFVSKLGERNFYCLTCKSHPRIETKSRYGDGRTWIDPTMEKVMLYINRDVQPDKYIPETKDEITIGTGL